MFRNMAAALIGVSMAASALPAEAASWSIDTAKSRLAFGGTQTGAPFSGQFGKFSGSIDFDPAHPENGQVKIAIDMASAKTGDTQRDGALPDADWFNIAMFPTATFETRSIKAVGPGRYVADGKLTIRGVTQPESLPFTLVVAGKTATMHGALTFSRQVFGVGQGEWASDQWVGFPVTVTVDLVAIAR